ncbi:hypothetical protein JHK87_054071 [Glycine soja]|nr:hypothetical protein JHK87_054071 [Glycine soja]
MMSSAVGLHHLFLIGASVGIGVGAKLEEGFRFRVGAGDVSICDFSVVQKVFSQQPRDVRWLYPTVGYVKLNTNESSAGNQGISGFGGVIQDSNACWVVGYAGPCAMTMNTIAELKAFYHGLEIACDQMGDSQENNKGKSRDKDNYVSWTMEDTNELLHLLVDAMNRGLRDANGSLSKQM